MKIAFVYLRDAHVSNSTRSSHFICNFSEKSIIQFIQNVRYCSLKDNITQDLVTIRAYKSSKNYQKLCKINNYKIIPINYDELINYKDSN